jgi:hypothetical protein
VVDESSRLVDTCHFSLLLRLVIIAESNCHASSSTQHGSGISSIRNGQDFTQQNGNDRCGSSVNRVIGQVACLFSFTVNNNNNNNTH